MSVVSSFWINYLFLSSGISTKNPHEVYSLDPALITDLPQGAVGFYFTKRLSFLYEEEGKLKNASTCEAVSPHYYAGLLFSRDDIEGMGGCGDLLENMRSDWYQMIHLHNGMWVPFDEGDEILPPGQFVPDQAATTPGSDTTA